MSYLAKKLFHNDNATHSFIVKLRPHARLKLNGLFGKLNARSDNNEIMFLTGKELSLLVCLQGRILLCCVSLQILDWFWTIISNFSDEQMARLLQFTTGCSQLPPGGFAELVPKFELSPGYTFNTLPTAHTW